jgi:hypothetical protein
MPLKKIKSIMWVFIILSFGLLAAFIEFLLQSDRLQADPFPQPKGDDLYTFAVILNPS